MKYAVHICCHTSLDDMPKKGWLYAEDILRALHAAGRFSCFDVPVKGPGARNIDYILHDSGWIARTWGEYPWTYVELTEKGKAALQ